jgi:membrane protein
MTSQVETPMSSNPALRRRRDASPWLLPRRRWWAVLVKVVKDVKNDHLSLLSGGVAFFGFLAVFPALGALVAAYGLMFDPAHVHGQLGQLEAVLPPSILGILEAQLQRLTAAASEDLSLGAVVALLTAVWLANKGARGLVEATNLAYDLEDSRGFVALTALSLAMTAGTLVAFVVLLALVAVLPAALAIVGLDETLEGLLGWLRWPVITLVLATGLAVIYAYAPNRKPARFRWVTPGSVAATGLLLLASAGFSLYVSSFGKYDEVYGSLGAVAVLLLWIYVSAFVVLLGAEVNAEVEAECRDLQEPT